MQVKKDLKDNFNILDVHYFDSIITQYYIKRQNKSTILCYNQHTILTTSKQND